MLLPRPLPSLESSGPGRAPAAPFSLIRYSPYLILVLVMVADTNRYADPDLWGHIRFGEAILATRHLPARDPYSYSAAGHLWRDHEWLSEVVIAGFYGILGVAGLKIMKLALAAATIILMALAEGESGAPPDVQLAVLTVAAVALSVQMKFRPQLFTFAMLAAIMWMLARDDNRRRGRLWMAIPMLAVWANLHGGFIIGLAALGTYAGFAILEDLFAGRRSGRGLVLLAIALGAGLATLATPYGLGSWSAVMQTLSSPMTRLAVAEWQPLPVALREAWRASPWALIYFACAIAMFAALCVSMIRTPGAGATGPAAVAILMAGATVFSARNMALFVVAAAGPLARRWAAMRGSGAGVPARHPRAGTEAHPTADLGAARQTPAKGAVHPLVGVAVAAALAAYTGLFSTRLREAPPCPAGAVGFMDSHELHGNLLNEYSWGEYLIWHEAPRSRVFIDSRYETAYPEQVMRDYLTFFFDRPGADKVLGAYPHDYVLVPPKSGAYRATARSKDWKLIYRDPMSTLFARANSAAAKLPELPASGSKPSDLFP